jgi:phosphoadenosine phosphosulfate reductase
MKPEGVATALAEFVARHEKIALLFSGGKDSVACLKLLRPHLEKVWVLWANPGDPYPETLGLMRKVRESVPHFFEARGEQPQFVKDFGHPVDMLPFESTAIGRLTAGDKPEMKLVSLDQCCNANMWIPLFRALRATGATGCVRGDKNLDEWRPRFASGAFLDGIEYHLPLFSCSDDEVLDFVGDDLPTSYRRGHPSSFDCMTCTAYLSHNTGRIRELAQLDQAKYIEVHHVLWHMRGKATKYLDAMESSL